MEVFMTVQFFLQRVSKRHLLQHRFEAASAHRGRTSLPCLTPHTQSTNLQVLPRPLSTTYQHPPALQHWNLDISIVCVGELFSLICFLNGYVYVFYV